MPDLSDLFQLGLIVSIIVGSCAGGMIYHQTRYFKIFLGE